MRMEAELQKGELRDTVPQVHGSIHVVSATLVKSTASTTQQHISRRIMRTLVHQSLYPRAHHPGQWAPTGLESPGN